MLRRWGAQGSLPTGLCEPAVSLVFFAGDFEGVAIELQSHIDVCWNHLFQSNQQVIHVLLREGHTNDVLQAFFSVDSLSVIAFSTLKRFSKIDRWLV
jgi:hypothetical protein